MLNPHLLELLELFRLDRTYVRGSGSWLEDDRGRRVLDFSSQYGALPFGHNPEALWDALDDVRRYAVPAMVQPSRPRHAEALAERLARLAPVGAKEGNAVVTFSQSGAEAIEAAIKLCRISTGRSLVIGAERGYHGKTLGASALTWKSSRELEAGVRPPSFAHVPWNDAGALERFLGERGKEVAAVVLEPVQGEGGVFEADPAYFPRVRELTRAHGVLLVLDEVQTGLGRLGALFGADQLGIRPDVIVLSKALGGGLVPLAACVASRETYSEEFALSHSSTFANNNLTCAVGLAVLDLLERDGRALVENARVAGEKLRAGVIALGERYPGVIRALRGRGCLLGLELEPVDGTSSYFLRHMFEVDAWNAIVASWLLNVRGLRVIPCLTHARALRLQPSLDVSGAEIDFALEALEALARTIHFQDWAALVSPLIGKDGERVPVDARSLAKPVVASRPAEPREEATRFAFLIHYTCPEDMVKTTPAFGLLSESEQRALYDWTARRPSHAPASFVPAIRGAHGALAQGWLVSLTDNPDSMRARPRALVSADIARAVRGAEELGAHVIGLGAFTSIMTVNGAEISTPAALTTGSALTVAMAVEGVRLACERMGADPREKRGLVLGLGVVGSAAAAVAAEFLPSLVFVGNPRRAEREQEKALALMDRIYARAARSLEDPGATGVAAELRRALPAFRSLGERGRKLVFLLLEVGRGAEAPAGLAREIAWACQAVGRRAPLELAPSLSLVVREADVIVSATSAATPLIFPDDLKPGAIVCDVAKPADVCRTVRDARRDVLVFDGGLVRYPEPIAFGQNIGYEPGINLACLTETIVLALEGVREGRFGIGLASGLLDEVPRIHAAARKHGFSVGELRADGRILTRASLDAIAEAARERLSRSSGRRPRSRSMPLSA
ncbi:aminotransferase class III-fold pyridoxal phosphate-dependent enzyme [bacterium]|nr:aminotransferase class III-fold pyridoxal phosphate-dependent enzyme [bacterium]